MTPRGDAPLIRHLTESGRLSTALAWQALPYVRLPGDGLMRYLWGERNALTAALPTLAGLPWQDAVYDLDEGRHTFVEAMNWTTRGGGAPVPPRGQSWLGLTRLPAYLQHARTASPWLSGPDDLLAPFRADADRWIALEVWESSTLHRDGTRGFPSYPDVSLIPRDDPWNPAALAHLYPNPGCRSGRAYGPAFCTLARCKYGSPPRDPRALPCLGSETVMVTGKLSHMMRARSRTYQWPKNPGSAASLTLTTASPTSFFRPQLCCYFGTTHLAKTGHRRPARAPRPGLPGGNRRAPRRGNAGGGGDEARRPPAQGQALAPHRSPALPAHRSAAGR